MLRGLAVVLIFAAIAGFFGYRYYVAQQAERVRQEQQINELSNQLDQLKKDDGVLRDQLAKVQEENNNLKGYNDILTKALETAKVTGKVPIMKPYPPK
jgi:predicted negative regulator of RcsB-dependent stress response